MNEEMLKKARAAKSAEELFEMAKANGFDISQEKAKEIFARLGSDSELSDEELGAVAGGCDTGGGGSSPVYCPVCGEEMEYFSCLSGPYATEETGYTCKHCGHFDSLFA